MRLPLPCLQRQQPGTGCAACKLASRHLGPTTVLQAAPPSLKSMLRRCCPAGRRPLLQTAHWPGCSPCPGLRVPLPCVAAAPACHMATCAFHDSRTPCRHPAHTGPVAAAATPSLPFMLEPFSSQALLRLDTAAQPLPAAPHRSASSTLSQRRGGPNNSRPVNSPQTPAWPQAPHRSRSWPWPPASGGSGPAPVAENRKGRPPGERQCGRW